MIYIYIYVCMYIYIYIYIYMYTHIMTGSLYDPMLSPWNPPTRQEGEMTYWDVPNGRSILRVSAGAPIHGSKAPGNRWEKEPFPDEIPWNPMKNHGCWLNPVTFPMNNRIFIHFLVTGWWSHRFHWEALCGIMWNYSWFIWEHWESMMIISGWWWLEHEFSFPFSWECHHPSWRTHIFQRGGSTTNQKYVSLK